MNSRWDPYGDRSTLIGFLADLPTTGAATHDEVLALVDANTLYGTGLGLVDVHLLAGVRLSASDRLWTRDRRLARAAQALGVSAGIES